MNYPFLSFVRAGLPVPSPHRRLRYAGWAVLLLSIICAACGSGKSGHSNAKPSSSVVITLATPDHGRPATAAGATPAAPQLAANLPLQPLQQCLVTRTRGVPSSYVPADLVTLPAGPTVRAGVQMRKEPAEALQALLDAARIEGQNLIVISAYRSYEQQQIVLDQEMKAYGLEQAQRQVAPPGHSEHQLGVAADVLSAKDPDDLSESFGNSPEGKWLAASAARFGFVISYPAGKETITGYIYEPWHVRYVGFPWAQQIGASGLTITEYLAQHGMAGC